MMTDRITRCDGPFRHIIQDGVEVDGWIYLSGQLSVDQDAQLVGGDDLAQQFQGAYRNVEATLRSFAADMGHVVEETLFVTDIRAFLARSDELFALRTQAYGGEPRVAQTLVQVVALGVPGAMVEIKCVARR
ncbi:RidA family protein [Pseudomonas putida]|uniref:RidA family protein n=1 Tax=Pseudomonas putida TaxID=303 RepID=UPI00383A32F0